MTGDRRPTLVLDSASLYYRAFFALPDTMTAPDGRPHNAIRGFLSTVTRLVDAQGPSGLVACWDNDWRPQWRVDLIPTYKAHRVAEPADADSTASEAEPESLGAQAVAIAAILEAMGIARIGVDGFEADDVAGSACAQHPGPAIVVSGDRDLVQLVRPGVRLLLTVNGGMDKWPLLDEPLVRERFGVDPSLYVDLAVLRGDPSDGLPGVPGIGAKTAAALVNAFGGIDAILAAAMEPAVKPMTPRLAALLLEHGDTVARARQVATVVPDLELGSLDFRAPVAPADPEALRRLVSEWGVQRQVDALAKSLARQRVDE